MDYDKKPVWQQPSAAGSYNAVTQPAHYARFAIQPIEFILANGLSFLQASVIKYLVRYPYKNGMEDLLKCRNMLDRLIAEEEKKAAGTAALAARLDAEMAAVKPPRDTIPPRPRAEIYLRHEDWKADMIEWEKKYGGLVGQPGEQVGGQPASEDAEDRPDRRDGPQ